MRGRRGTSTSCQQADQRVMKHRFPGTTLRPLLAAILAALALAGQPSTGRPLIAQEADPLFVRGDLVIAGAFVAGMLAARPLDRAVAERLQVPWAQENRLLKRAASTFNFTAAPGSVIIGTTMYAVGRVGGNERLASLGLHGTEAIGVGILATAVIKNVVGRARPYVDVKNPRDFGFMRGWGQEKYRSFPSGHSTMAFAAAAAVTSETARWWPRSEARWAVGTAMYGGAALVGASRMYSNKHWATDVIAGAAIGTFAGIKTVRYHREHPRNRLDRWLLTGNVSGRGVGLMLLPL